MMYDCDESRMSLRAPRELPPLPAAVEVAIFHIVREAVINVSRHAGPCSCQVHVDVLPDGTAMCCDVRDDGRGFPSPHPAGIGQMSMRERAAELNGTLSITSTPGVGTHIHARIPCALIPPASSQVEPAVLTDHLPAVSIESE
jgi:signal transduction histidine kinase